MRIQRRTNLDRIRDAGKWFWKNAKFLLAAVVLGAGALLFSLVSLATRVPEAYPVRPPGHMPPLLSDSQDGLVTFVHVAGVGLSILDSGSFDRFDAFLASLQPRFAAQLVLMTGNAVVGRASGYPALRGGQLVSEWLPYQTGLVDAGMFDPEFWFDLPGSQDVQNLLDFEDERSLFPRYSVSGVASRITAAQHVFVHDLHVGSANQTTYRFAFFDATSFPSLSFPYNSAGYLRTQLIEEIDAALDAHVTPANATFLVGAFPESFMGTFADGEFHDLVRKHGVSMYLCGHAFGPGHVTRRPGDYIEVSTADFQPKSRFQLFALDNGVVSFTDVVGESKDPVVLLTNPKDARWLTAADAHGNVAESSHVRALVYSEEPVQQVSLLINGQVLCDNMTLTSGPAPLWVCPWDLSEWTTSGSVIQATATTASGRVGSAEHVFSTSGQAVSGGTSFIQLLAELHVFPLLLVLNAWAYAYAFLWLVITPRVYSYYLKRTGQFDTWHRVMKDRLNDQDHLISGAVIMGRKLLHKNWNLRPAWLGRLPQKTLWRFDRIPQEHFLVLVLVGIYLPLGPLVFGPVIEDRSWGAVFWWGTMIDGVATPSWEVQLLGFLTIIALYLPLVLYVSLPSFRSHHQRRVIEEPDHFITPSAQPHVFRQGFFIVLWMIFSYALLLSMVINVFGVTCAWMSPAFSWLGLLSVYIVYGIVRDELNSGKDLEYFIKSATGEPLLPPLAGADQESGSRASDRRLSDAMRSADTSASRSHLASSGGASIGVGPITPVAAAPAAAAATTQPDFAALRREQIVEVRQAIGLALERFDNNSLSGADLVVELERLTARLRVRTRSSRRRSSSRSRVRDAPTPAAALYHSLRGSPKGSPSSATPLEVDAALDDRAVPVDDIGDDPAGEDDGDDHDVVVNPFAMMNLEAEKSAAVQSGEEDHPVSDS